MAVLDQYGARDYWKNFPDNFFGNRHLFGDGSQYFRVTMRKLVNACTKTPPLPVQILDDIGQRRRDKDAFIKQKLSEAIPSSYMPSPYSQIKVGSLIAVHLTEERCGELGLVGFKDFQPLLARVCQVLDAENMECVWLVSQPLKGPHCEDGLSDGYRGRWHDWESDGEVFKTILKTDDCYARNFKLLPGSNRLCGPLAHVLKANLASFIEYRAERELEDENLDLGSLDEDNAEDD